VGAEEASGTGERQVLWGRKGDTLLTEMGGKVSIRGPLSVDCIGGKVLRVPREVNKKDGT